jgi:hypothetical protein
MGRERTTIDDQSHQHLTIRCRASGTLAAFALQGPLASYALTLGVSTGHHSRTSVVVAFALGSVLQVGGLAF